MKKLLPILALLLFATGCGSKATVCGYTDTTDDMDVDMSISINADGDAITKQVNTLSIKMATKEAADSYEEHLKGGATLDIPGFSQSIKRDGELTVISTQSLDLKQASLEDLVSSGVLLEGEETLSRKETIDNLKVLGYTCDPTE
ncbi:DUF1307 domain-containing protein [Erysipelothrix sp. HDW6C]|uniref:DUF1307 domain-containing protein n=1 Tax=Erysipelothrix sp. HDW6C TaxID=2714930 RepID=UPI00140DA36A|nr:DUF1307 domain-containing protein [Erysipelothrix sp. HDW6C]QIK69146.1 DUF1307 domain-containing protein [Erysipelothrix sp. HDW6C]